MAVNSLLDLHLVLTNCETKRSPGDADKSTPGLRIYSISGLPVEN